MHLRFKMAAWIVLNQHTLFSKGAFLELGCLLVFSQQILSADCSKMVLRCTDTLRLFLQGNHFLCTRKKILSKSYKSVFSTNETFNFKSSMFQITAVVPDNETTTILFNYKHIINEHYIIILYNHYKNLNYPFLFYMKMVGLKGHSRPEKPIHS